MEKSDKSPNINYYIELVGGEESMIAELIELLKSGFKNDFDQYLQSVREDDLDAMHKALHKLKFKVNTLSMLIQAVKVTEFEAALKQGRRIPTDKCTKVLKKVGEYINSL